MRRIVFSKTSVDYFSTIINSITESVTEEERCCKEIVVIDLPECCLGTEFNLQ